MELRAERCAPCQIHACLPLVSSARHCARRRIVNLARLGADAHRHQDVEERSLNLQNAGAHLVN
jgi:hypothetical protein